MVTSINRGGLLELIDQGAEVVDALSDAEYAAQYIPGAISIPLRRLNAQTTSERYRYKDHQEHPDGAAETDEERKGKPR